MLSRCLEVLHADLVRGLAISGRSMPKLVEERCAAAGKLRGAQRIGYASSHGVTQATVNAYIARFGSRERRVNPVLAADQRSWGSRED